MRLAALFEFSIAAGVVWAHGDHEQMPIPADADWATRHMIEEHHISTYDAGAFFNLHDFDGSGQWTTEDIGKMYGMYHVSTASIEQNAKLDAIRKVLDLFDRDRSNSISMAEFIIGDGQGIKLPDFGFGPGHHGDDEYEYEIHHFEKYHGADAKLEDMTHPEDIEHFRMHDQLEEQAQRQEMLDRMEIVSANIPMKFRRVS